MFSLVFPGQGSQKVGMCSDFYSKFKNVKELFNNANDILKYNLTDVILKGPQEKLNQTEYAQPAIFLVGYSIIDTLKKECEFNFDNYNFFAGHSLGEYTALAVSGSITFEQALILLKNRGRSMQEAVPIGTGGMLAVLGSDIERISTLLKLYSGEFKCYIANDNSYGQIIISGTNPDLEKFSLILKKENIKNLKLPVSAPFHCEMMNSASQIMEPIINSQDIKLPSKKIISNVTAKEYGSVKEIKNLLIKQIESPVRWRESIEYMMKNGVNCFVEIGPGKVLSGMIKRIKKDIEIINIDKIDDLKNLKND